MGNRFEAKLLWATALQRCFGEQLWEAASGNRFREQLWQAFRNNFEEHLLSRTAALGAAFGGSFTNNVGEQLSVATFGSSFREPLCRIALGSRFGKQVCRIAAFGQQLWRGVLGSSFGKQLWGTALGSSFGNLSGTTLRKNCFEEQQLWEQLYNFREQQLSGAAFGSRFAE